MLSLEDPANSLTLIRCLILVSCQNQCTFWMLRILLYKTEVGGGSNSHFVLFCYVKSISYSRVDDVFMRPISKAQYEFCWNAYFQGWWNGAAISRPCRAIVAAEAR